MAVVNETLARRLFPVGDAVGRRIRFGAAQQVVEVIGVTADIRVSGLTEAPRPLLFRSLGQTSTARSMILMRTAVPPEALSAQVRRVVAALDPQVAIVGPATLEERAWAGLLGTRFGVVASGTFGALTLLLTVAGLYGVVASGVARRTREIGIRIALGAGTRGVAGLVVRRGVALVSIGLAVGGAGADALSGVLGRLLYDVSPTNPAAVATAGTITFAVGLLASWIPARWASHVDPVRVLRAE